MRVKDCMCKKVVQASGDATLEQVAKLMQTNHVGCIPICDQQNQVVGFVTDRDIITRGVANHKDCSQTKVTDIMTTKVIKTTPDTDIDDATETMANNQIKRLPVIENNQIVGMLTIGDLAQHDEFSYEALGDTMEDICSCENNN